MRTLPSAKPSNAMLRHQKPLLGADSSLDARQETSPLDLSICVDSSAFPRCAINFRETRIIMSVATTPPVIAYDLGAPFRRGLIL